MREIILLALIFSFGLHNLSQIKIEDNKQSKFDVPKSTNELRPIYFYNRKANKVLNIERDNEKLYIHNYESMKLRDEIVCIKSNHNRIDLRSICDI